MTAYYNEFDAYTADWLGNLMAEGLIPRGHIDTRSIKDVQPSDLAGFTQCHFFAGIGGWPLAFRLAGWPDSRPVWSGSCPCQPFSIANVAHGGATGQDDERHLLPHFTDLIGQCCPPVVFGEQVERAIGWGWLDEAFGTLEGFEYACAAAVYPALAVGARHERKRLYWVADAGRSGRPGYQPVERIPVSERAAQPVYGDPLAGARRALAGDYSDLLSGDGVSIAVERLTAKGYGNAIVPEAAQAFIEAYLETEHLRLMSDLPTDEGIFA